MIAVNVLVVFYSGGGETERLALAAGVGAIQAHANIRLRRLPPGPELQTAMTAEQREHIERMARDYVAPRPADALWADVIILGMPSEGARDMQIYAEGLAALGPAQAAPRVAPMPPTLDSIDAAHAFGREAVAIARALKGAEAGR